jgi:hypothetical protein
MAMAALSAAGPVATFAQAPTPPQPSPEEVMPQGPVAIEVHARPIGSFDLRDRSQTMFGQLQFRSGLVLTSSFRGFGGLSAFRLDTKGERFLSLSDKGSWFTGRIVYSGKEMTGLADVEVAPILGPDGEPVTTRRWYDTESLARDGGTVYVGIERVNQILKFDFGRDGIRARGQPMALPTNLRKLPNNKGLESLVVLPKNAPLAGALLAISERGLDADGNIIGALIGGSKPGALAVHRTDNYDISDAGLLPNGDLLLLERKFSLVAGVGIRIRRVPIASVLPGALLDGPSIFDADLGHEIDNMEGIDTHVTADGDTVITMISDDNFSIIQRTLLLQFTLVE